MSAALHSAPERPRRQQLLDTAAALLVGRGVDGVRVPDVAAAAGVTRPVVYKHFKNRQALIIGVVEDYMAELDASFAVALRGQRSLEDSMRAVLEATCDVLEAKGRGAWDLLGAPGPDPEVEQVAAVARERVLIRWRKPLRKTTGANKREVETLSHMVSAASRAALGLWLDGRLPRAEAIDAAMLGTMALIDVYRSQHYLR